MERVKYTKPQLDCLEEQFQKTAYVNTRTVEMLANRLGVSAKQIRIWFQNRRARARRELLKRDVQLTAGRNIVCRPASIESPPDSVPTSGARSPDTVDSVRWSDSSSNLRVSSYEPPSVHAGVFGSVSGPSTQRVYGGHPHRAFSLRFPSVYRTAGEEHEDLGQFFEQNTCDVPSVVYGDDEYRLVDAVSPPHSAISAFSPRPSSQSASSMDLDFITTSLDWFNNFA